MPFDASAARNTEQPDLGGGIKAEAEEKPERIHMPASPDQTEERAEYTGDQTAAGHERIEVFLHIWAALPHAVERTIHRDQDHQIDDRDGQEEQRGHGGADDAPDVAQRR